MDRHYHIDLPIARYAGELRVEKVTVASRIELKRHVERFARYFLREMHFGGIQYEARETTESLGFVEYRAFLFVRHDRYVGAGCFRHRADQDDRHPWLFDWLWLHPYFRRRGVLMLAWPELLAEVGDFRIAKPVSVHMESFLSKVGWCEPGSSLRTT